MPLRIRIDLTTAIGAAIGLIGIVVFLSSNAIADPNVPDNGSYIKIK